MFGFTPDPLGIDNVRSVHGRSGVDQIIVPAGHRVLLMDADDAVFYVKETDMRGLSVVQAYTFAEQMADPAPTYVTQDQFDELRQNYESLVAQLNAATATDEPESICNAMNFNDLENQVGRMNDLMQTQFMQTSYLGGAAIAAGGTIPIGYATHRVGCGSVDGDAITLRAPAAITAVVGFVPTAAGNVTISMLDNGVVIATQTVTATAGGAISVPITVAVRPCCKPSRINFSVNVAGTAGEVQVVAIS